MSLPENGYTQPVEIIVGGALPRAGYVQPIEIVAGSGMVIGLPVSGGTPGDVLFVDAAGNLGQSASLTWDNANLTFTVLNNQTLTYASGEKLAIRGRNDASTTGNSIIAPMYGAQVIAFYDAVQGIGLIPSGSTITQVNGVAGYIKAATASMPNGVCLFGAGMVTVNSATVWGANTVLMDNSTKTVGALTGVSMIGAELDFNVMCPGTSISGVTLTGSSLSQPTSANGFRLATLGTGITWSLGFVTDNGVCSNFASIGATATAAANIGSQPILFNYFNAASAAKIYQLNVNTSGQLIIAGNDTSPVFRLSSAALIVDQTATITGQFLGKVGTAASPGWSFSAHTSDGVYWEGNVGAPTFVVGGVVSVGYGGNTMWVPSNTQLNFMTGTISAGGAGFSVVRDANDILAIKHGANQCTLRVYGNSSGIYATVTSDGTNAFFTQTGGNQIAFATAAKGTGDTVGYICIPSCAGTPTGVPANIPTGQIPIVYDATNNFLYVYNGGWKKSTVYA